MFILYLDKLYQWAQLWSSGWLGFGTLLDICLALYWLNKVGRIILHLLCSDCDCSVPHLVGRQSHRRPSYSTFLLFVNCRHDVPLPAFRGIPGTVPPVQLQIVLFPDSGAPGRRGSSACIRTILHTSFLSRKTYSHMYACTPGIRRSHFLQQSPDRYVTGADFCSVAIPLKCRVKNRAKFQILFAC